MKKILLGATALAMVGAGAASAQTWDARVGGFFTGGAGIVDTDVDQGSSVALVNDSEIHFNFTLTADNGITFGFRTEMNASGLGAIDESNAFVRGAFGSLEIGNEDGAHDRMRVALPSADFTSPGGASGFLFDQETAASPAGSFGAASGVRSGDALKITYFTPRIAGFQAAASYANRAQIFSRASGDDPGVATPTITPVASSTSTNITETRQEAYEFGANYSGEFSGVSILVGGGMSFYDGGSSVRAQRIGTGGYGDGPGQLDSSYTIGATIGYAGFRFGGRFGSTKRNERRREENYSLGADYTTGPWKMGVNFAQRSKSATRRAENDWGLSGGVSYALAPGVKVGGVVEYADGSLNVPDGGSAIGAGVVLGLNF